MSGVQGWQTDSVEYAPTGAALGDVYVVGQGTDGLVMARVEYPSGAGEGDYVFVTGPSGVPVWKPTTDIVGSASYAWVPLTGIDGDGNTVFITDENGEPILAYAPV